MARSLGSKANKGFKYAVLIKWSESCTAESFIWFWNTSVWNILLFVTHQCRTTVKNTEEQDPCTLTENVIELFSSLVRIKFTLMYFICGISLAINMFVFAADCSVKWCNYS